MEAHAGVCQPKSFSHLGFQLENASRSGLSSETLIETRRNQLSPLLVQIEPSKLVYLLNLKKKDSPGHARPGVVTFQGNWRLWSPTCTELNSQFQGGLVHLKSMYQDHLKFESVFTFSVKCRLKKSLRSQRGKLKTTQIS